MMLRIVCGSTLFLLMVSFVAGKDESPATLVAGRPVEADAKLQKGDKLVAVYDKKNYVVEILEVKSNKKVNIRWVATGEKTDDVGQTELYYAGDSTPTRKSRKSPLPDNYQALDKNQDGQIGLYEWDRAKYAEFRKLDKNRDGFLTPQELTARVLAAPGAAAGTPATKDGESKDSKDAKELENPGNLVGYADQAKKSFTFKVTGKIGGDVWGTGPYYVESDLAAAAVHSGILKDGVAGNVKVTILESADQFMSATKNGVTSMERGDSGPAFTIEAVK